MNPQDNTTNERESLSALLDGELGAEARRFALRRLAHDVDWQQSAGRWQMIGDAMRRQAPIGAPADFASRVHAAVAADAVAAPVAGATVAGARVSRRRYRWAGGALAASVALAAVIALRPTAVEPTARPAVAAARTSASPASAPAAVPAVPAPAAVASAEATPAPAPVASVTPPTEPSASPRRARLVAAAEARPLARRAVPTSSVAAQAPVLVTDAANPFRLQAADSIDAQPWPRASLTGAPTGAFTARYGNGRQPAADAPSFYPFEPRLESGLGAGEAPPAP